MSRGTLAVSLVGGAARVAVGVMWLLEGIEKYRAGFGAGDIAFVGQSGRVPWWYAPLGAVMDAAPAAFGVLVPLLEVALGVALISGLFTRTAAFLSVGLLMLYWAADQLIAQYPAMAMLSVVAIALSGAGMIGIDGWMSRRRRTRPWQVTPDDR